ncbi:MAG: methionine adenosyltransferase [Acidimicrobiaceae bacterium]|nr:methionine adenosyltransferase [Acidimicrobiaceae bacterium]
MNPSFTFTSESVTEGHPDKMADQISDAILDALIEKDPLSRVACETLVTTGMTLVTGEITTEDAYVDIPGIVRNTICKIGYDKPSFGFDGNTCGVMIAIDEQSTDIAQGVDASVEARSGIAQDEWDSIGAGDQGLMFGYATNETENFMPQPLDLAHKMAKQLTEIRRSGVVPYLRPDGKTQITIDYENGKPTRLRNVVVSSQHNAGIDRSHQIEPDLIEHVIRPVIPEQFQDDSYDVHVNPSGRFVIGGPVGDAGLTGRKIIVDTYGGMARHGGGAFSGKDPSKVDRSAAYATRWVAKNVVASGAAERCEVQVAYAIGIARPMSVLVETFGTEKVSPEAIASAVYEIFDLRPAAIIHNLDLRRPIYAQTAAYGHFGREGNSFTWEKLDKVDDLKAALGI